MGVDATTICGTDGHQRVGDLRPSAAWALLTVVHRHPACTAGNTPVPYQRLHLQLPALGYFA